MCQQVNSNSFYLKTQEETAKRIISLAAEKTEEMLRKEIVVVDEV